MGTKITFWGAMVIAGVSAGCQITWNKPATQPSPASLPTTDPSTTSADDLARKATAWAKMMEAVRLKREADTQPATSQPTVPTPTSRPAEVTITAPKATTKPTDGATTALVFPSPATLIEIHAPAATAPASRPVSVQAPPPRIVIKDEISERVNEGLKNSPRDPAANLDYQLVRFLREEQAPDMTSLASLPAEDREAISAVVDGLANFRAVLRADPNGMPAKKVRPLVEMSDRLRAQTDLQIPSAVLCTAVRGYGSYDPMKTAFMQGRENRALLYCEVTGFASRIGAEGGWETQLTEEVVLFRGDAEVWRKLKVDQVLDKCRNKRRDFYVMNLLQFPSTLMAGAYTMKITLIDRIANRVTEATLPVTIVGTGAAAGN